MGERSQNLNHKSEITPITQKTKSKFQSLPMTLLQPFYLALFLSSCLSSQAPKSILLPQRGQFHAPASLNMPCFTVLANAPAGKHSSFKIQLKFYLFLEVFSEFFFCLAEPTTHPSFYQTVQCINIMAFISFFSPLQGNKLCGRKDHSYTSLQPHLTYC